MKRRDVMQVIKFLIRYSCDRVDKVIIKHFFFCLGWLWSCWCSAYNTLFYLFFFWSANASAPDHLMRFFFSLALARSLSLCRPLCHLFLCTRFKHYYRKWTAEQMKFLPDVAKAIFLFEKFARFTWNARSMSSSACNFWAFTRPAPCSTHTHTHFVRWHWLLQRDMMGCGTVAMALPWIPMLSYNSISVCLYVRLCAALCCCRCCMPFFRRCTFHSN